MSIVGILLITIAVLAGIDVVMYLVLSGVDRHWEKRFEKEEDENDDSDEGFSDDRRRWGWWGCFSSPTSHIIFGSGLR